MKRAGALAILALPQEQAVARILALAEKAEAWDKAHPDEPLDKTDSPDESAGKAPPPGTPSGMTAPYHKTAHRRRRRKPGRKRGHRGTRRAPPPHVNHTIPHTLSHCPHCNLALGDSIRQHTRVIEDLPPTPPQVHQHQIHGYWCSQCHKIVTPTVTEALPRSTLGLNVLVYTAWLHYLLGISVGHIVRLLGVSFNFSVSPGGLTQAWARLAESLKPYYEQLEQQVRQAGVLHADETGWRINGLTHWLWAFCTERVCYFLIDRHRSSAIVARVLGEFFDGILITDFYAAYNLVEAWAKQRCLFHLFTELLRVDKRNTHPPWKAFRKQLSRLLKDAMRLKTQQNELDAVVYERRKQRLHQRLDQLIAQPFNDADAKRLAKRLANFRGELLTFLNHEAVAPTNNFAEQQMRKPVAARKVCQQNRSARGAETHAILLTLFRTAELRGEHPVRFVITLIKAALEGRIVSLDNPNTSFEQAA